jgi:hypothetical protein
VTTVPPATRLPRLAAYLAALPGGLAAYPDCIAKGALVRAAVDHRTDLRGWAAWLPPELGRLLLDLPLAGEWIPEAHFVALFHAQADLLGLDEVAVLARSRERSRRLFESPAYRILMAVLSPVTLLRFSGRRWENFHRGTRLEVGGTSDDGVRVVLRFPPGLFDRLVLLAFGQAFAAALELSGAHDPVAHLERQEAESGHFRLVWG